ncbi:MAG: alpha/beta fold hydrolase [Thermogutta sp.]|jgi:pimeloyl-ACP methyl ester carboxylesterase
MRRKRVVAAVVWASVLVWLMGTCGLNTCAIAQVRPQAPAANQAPRQVQPPAPPSQPAPQRPVPPAAAPAPKPPAPPTTSQRLPAPVEVSGTDLLTKDGVQLQATYYPSNKGKDAAVVMLIHGWKGSRRDFDRLAPFLQQQGYAVFVPDLRGHGASTQRLLPTPTTITVDKMPPTEVARMVDMDLETCKRFLLQKNNAGELNIEKLCLLGLDVGATVALDWARLDWSWPVYPGLKQGQDVKALILVSPKWSVPGLNVQAAMSHPGVTKALSIFLIVGKDSGKDLADAQRMYNIFSRFHPTPKEENPELQDLYFAKLPSTAQGKDLLLRFEQPLFQSIAYFVEHRVAKQPFPWQDRSKRKDQ